jgi:putative ABC transport system permease protein
LRADLYIAAEGFQHESFLPQQVVDEAPRLPSVAAVSVYRSIQLQIGDKPAELIAARLAAQSRDGFDLVAQLEKPWQKFVQGEVIISEPLAYRMAVRPGEPLLISTPQGEREFRVAAIFRDYASEHGRLFIDLEWYRQYWPDPRVNTLALFSSSADGRALQVIASDHFDTRFRLVYTDAKAIYKESMAVFDRTFRITEVLRVLSIMVAFIGILSALMAVQLERRKEFAILRALGLTRFQVSLLIMIESSMLGLLAALFAIPVGLALAWVLTDAVQVRAFGWTMPFLVSAPPLLWTIFIGVSAALLASLYPAWQASRGDPAPHMRED